MNMTLIEFLTTKSNSLKKQADNAYFIILLLLFSVGVLSHSILCQPLAASPMHTMFCLYKGSEAQSGDFKVFS